MPQKRFRKLLMIYLSKSRAWNLHKMNFCTPLHCTGTRNPPAEISNKKNLYFGKLLLHFPNDRGTNINLTNSNRLEQDFFALTHLNTVMLWIWACSCLSSGCTLRVGPTLSVRGRTDPEWRGLPTALQRPAHPPKVAAACLSCR